MPAALIVTPDSVSIRVGQNLQMHALVLDSAGDTLTTNAPTWSSSDTTILSVSAGGLVTARSHGTAFVIARLDSLDGSAYLRVLIPVQYIGVHPSFVVLVPGGTFKLTATLVGVDGSVLTDRDVSWRYRGNTIAIQSTGMIKALTTMGPDSIRAVSEGIESYNYVTSDVHYVKFARIMSNQLSNHTCAIDTLTIRASCWGSNAFGALGNGTFGDSLGNAAYWPPPTTGGLASPTGVRGVARLLATGDEMTCSVSGESVWCWGANDEYSLGNGPGPNQAVPQLVDVPAASSVVVGEEWACALGTDSIPRCWGGSVTGFLIDPTPLPNRKYTSIFAGYTRLCGIGIDSLAYCGLPQVTGQPLVSPSLRLTTLAIGQDHVCGVTTDSTAYCWGQNDQGQLGDSTTTAHATPAPITGLKFTQVTAGYKFSCGLAAPSGAVYCWGWNQDGVIGAAPGNFTSPTSVGGGITFVQITSGSAHACGIAATGKTYCWGANEYGQLGDGTNINRSQPTLVAGQVP